MQKFIPKKKVAFYIRVSTHDQAEMFGEDLQLEKAKRYIDLKDDLVFAGDQYIYKDLAVSGADEISERPELTRLFNDLKYSEGDPPFDVVLVYKIDRFARKLSVLLEIVETLDSYGVKFASAVEAIDT